MNTTMMPSRRSVLKAAGATLVVAGIAPGGEVFGFSNAWAAQAKNLKPETFATLVQMSRDIYPHPQLEDKIYADAVSGLDVAANDDKELLQLMEGGVADLDKATTAAKAASYSAVEDEGGRMEQLKAIEQTPFFQKIRSNLVTGIYNNQSVWPIFGYEGASADKGGYIGRGFDDIDWV